MRASCIGHSLCFYVNNEVRHQRGQGSKEEGRRMETFLAALYCAQVHSHIAPAFKGSILTFFLRIFRLACCRYLEKFQCTARQSSIWAINSQLDFHQSLDRLLGMTMPTFHCTAEHSSYPTVLPSREPNSMAHTVQHCANTCPVKHRTHGISSRSRKSATFRRPY